MKFTISCATFARLASITEFFDPATDQEIVDHLSCVRLEAIGGHVLGIVTNHKIAVIEYLGPTNEPDAVAHIKADPVLINQCRTEAAFDSFLEIVYVPEILLATVKTMMGYSYQGNAAIEGMPEMSPMKNWRKWFPDEMPKKSKGFLYFNIDYISMLVKSSPSAGVVFPEHIDTDVPVVLRDRDNPNWCGLFFPKATAPLQPATIPQWV